MGLLWFFLLGSKMTLYALFCPSSDGPYKVSADHSVPFFSCFPKSRGCCLLFPLSLPPRCLHQEKENRLTGHTTQCTCCSFLVFFVFVLCVIKMANLVVMWYLAAFGSNSPRFRGELLVPLFCCDCCSLGTTLIQRAVSLSLISF